MTELNKRELRKLYLKAKEEQDEERIRNLKETLCLIK